MGALCGTSKNEKIKVDDKSKAPSVLNVVDKYGDPVNLNKFDMVGLYFSSNNDPASQEFTTYLVESYRTWMSKEESIEIVFVPKDGDEQTANEQYKKMNFSRLVYDEKIIKELNSRLKVDNTPHLNIRTSDLKQTITRKAIDHMKNKKKAGSIIWWRRLFNQLPNRAKIPLFFSDEWPKYDEENGGENEPCNRDSTINDFFFTVGGINDCGVIYSYERVNFKKHASETSTTQINFSFQPLSLPGIIVDWINYDGICEEKFTMKGEEVKIKSYTGHRWLLRKPNGRPFAIYNPEHSIKSNSTVYIYIKSYEEVCIDVKES